MSGFALEPVLLAGGIPAGLIIFLIFVFFSLIGKVLEHVNKVAQEKARQAGRGGPTGPTGQAGPTAPPNAAPRTMAQEELEARLRRLLGRPAEPAPDGTRRAPPPPKPAVRHAAPHPIGMSVAKDYDAAATRVGASASAILSPRASAQPSTGRHAPVHVKPDARDRRAKRRSVGANVHALFRNRSVSTLQTAFVLTELFGPPGGITAKES